MMSDLGSAPIPGLSEQDHVRGPSGGRTLLVYADFECPFCAALDVRLRALTADRVVFRHFPVRSSHPRAWPAACAARGGGRRPPPAARVVSRPFRVRSTPPRAGPAACAAEAAGLQGRFWEM